MAVNNKMVWTDEGIRWVSATVKELATINATTASRLLNTFQHVGKLRSPLRVKVIEALRAVLEGVSSEACPTIHGQAKAYLQSVE